MRPTRHLVIFARYPMLGRGKRRLAADIGDVEAVRFQRVRLKLLLMTLRSDWRWRTWLAVTPDGAGPWPNQLGLIRQGFGDLGRRLDHVVKSLPREEVVIIGSDAPDITRGDIANAFTHLAGHDAVIGPALDGGYWLIGLRHRALSRRPFANVRWSSTSALEDTGKALSWASVSYLRPLNDVDDVQSLSRHPTWNRLIAVSRA